MDYTLLKTFTTVAHTGNLTQAAERLHLSQPAVSAQIKALEKKLDVALFTRTASGMMLTIAGEAFLPEAETLLQHHHQLDCFAKTLSQHYIATAELGLIHPAPPEKITALTRKILADNSNLQLHIQYGMSGEIEQRILEKQLHGGFFLGPVTHRGLRNIFLEDIHYSLICHQRDAETILKDLPCSLERYAWIEMSVVSSSRKYMQRFWRQHNISPKQQIVCDYPQTIIDLVCEGVGVAMVPEHKALSACKSGKPIVMLEDYRQTLPLNFIYLDEYAADPVLNILKDGVQSIWGK
ncbi:LysR family transcriptional regulator [Neisseria weaveri]|uniref:LysR family transcriptional regulator n=1 Tax=Neisseria weaveri TaxID=28091 RepID=A0A448VQV7_9NEIS|nr:LysR family transcriptional regulator [Neisseria weaveri]EGV34821.1 hypothetical protein l13_20820 [Neisseria weaveri ATCC 51223]EGV38016.1 hypothetical protein l11_07530 [Neisseria weaveri LMG 5135]SAY50752.1 LysR family transcriptional regulator [Neisseria weaveri]VEJ52151.1 LysR family transcriptional regulator [Neisseria weaveri]